MESDSRTRWLGKLRPAGAPHRWRGRGPDGTCRGHWLIPLLKKLDSCMSSLRLSMLFFSVSLQAKTPRNYVRRPCAGAVLVLIVSSLYMVSNHSTILDLCMADKHQYSSLRASAADGQSATSDRVSSQQMTPMHSHSSRRSSSRPRLKEVCA